MLVNVDEATMVALVRRRLMILLLLYWTTCFIPTAAPLSHFDTIFYIGIATITSEIISCHLIRMMIVINTITATIIAFVTSLVALIMVWTRLLVRVTSVIAPHIVVLHVVGTTHAGQWMQVSVLNKV